MVGSPLSLQHMFISREFSQSIGVRVRVVGFSSEIYFDRFVQGWAESYAALVVSAIDLVVVGQLQGRLDAPACTIIGGGQKNSPSQDVPLSLDANKRRKLSRHH